MNQERETGFRSTLRSTAKQLLLDLQTIRDTFDHNGIKGTQAEESFRKFIQRHLPGSVGVTSGQIVDLYGNKSGQLDMILFDRPRTPMLFGDEGSASHSVPAEGAIAVIEVKSKLTKQMLPDLISSCHKVKTLKKEAYLPTESTLRYIRYGTAFDSLPIYYTVFSFESDNTYAGPLNDAQLNFPLEKRIDSLCYLDRGVSLNACVDWRSHEVTYSASPEPGSLLADTKDHESALLHWFAAVSTAVAQRESRPIDLTRYLYGDLNLAASIPAGSATSQFTNQALSDIASKMGVRADLLRKFHQGAELSLNEVVEILIVDENYIQESPGMPQVSRDRLKLAKQVARDARATTNQP